MAAGMKMALFMFVCLIYLLSGISYFLYLIRRKGWFLSFGKAALLLGFLLQTIQLVGHSIAFGRLPAGSWLEGFGLVGWAVIGLYFILLFKYRIEALGGLIAFLGLIFWSLPVLLKAVVIPADRVVLDAWLYIHSTFIFASYAIFAIAFISSMLYLAEEHALKIHNAKMPFAVLPSLEDIERVNYKMVLFGFMLLTLGIAMGAIWSMYMRGSLYIKDPKIISSFLTWLIYGCVLYFKSMRGFSSKRFALLCIVGFGFVIVTFFGAGHGDNRIWVKP